MPNTHEAIAPPTVLTELVSPVATPVWVRGSSGCRGRRQRRDQGARAQADDDHVGDDLGVGVMERQEEQEADADEQSRRP